MRPEAGDESELLLDPGAFEDCELTVVMPVYNEEGSLRGCVLSWIDTLDALEINYRLLLIDDGSTDATPQVLNEFDSNRRVIAVSKQNEGHGPTILKGYRFAVLTSQWAFQVDSDDEIPATAFPELWAARDGVDAVFGVRMGRDQSVDRKLISRTAAATSRTLFKSKVRDVNVPYRLISSESLGPLLGMLPADTFAPNVVISGVLGRDETRFHEVEVPHVTRSTGEVSIAGWGAMKAAAKSFGQTVRLVRSV